MPSLVKPTGILPTFWVWTNMSIASRVSVASSYASWLDLQILRQEIQAWCSIRLDVDSNVWLLWLAALSDFVLKPTLHSSRKSMSTVIVWGCLGLFTAGNCLCLAGIPTQRSVLSVGVTRKLKSFPTLTFDFQCQFLVTCAVFGINQYFWLIISQYLLRKGCLKSEQTSIKRDFINHRLSKNKGSTLLVKKECHFCSHCLYSTIKYFLAFLSYVSSSLNKLSFNQFYSCSTLTRV